MKLKQIEAILKAEKLLLFPKRPPANGSETEQLFTPFTIYRNSRKTTYLLCLILQRTSGTNSILRSGSYRLL